MTTDRKPDRIIKDMLDDDKPWVVISRRYGQDVERFKTRDAARRAYGLALGRKAKAIGEAGS